MMNTPTLGTPAAGAPDNPFPLTDNACPIPGPDSGPPGAGMTFRVTHIDHNHCRRRLRVSNVHSQAAAMAWVEQLYGYGWYMAAMREDF